MKTILNLLGILLFDGWGGGLRHAAFRQLVADLRNLLGIEVGVKVDELAPTQAQDTCIPSLTLASTRLGINYLLKPSST